MALYFAPFGRTERFAINLRHTGSFVGTHTAEAVAKDNIKKVKVRKRFTVDKPLSGLTMRCSEPGRCDAVAIVASRGPGR
jgi:hypothetical protein